MANSRPQEKAAVFFVTILSAGLVLLYQWASYPPCAALRSCYPLFGAKKQNRHHKIRILGAFCVSAL
jgi:hypothetical protein